jgi:ribosomal protein L37E
MNSESRDDQPAGQDESGFAPADVREQDRWDHPHDEDCPKCGRRQWTDENAPETCQACGYTIQESDYS